MEDCFETVDGIRFRVKGQLEHRKNHVFITVRCYIVVVNDKQLNQVSYKTTGNMFVNQALNNTSVSTIELIRINCVIFAVIQLPSREVINVTQIAQGLGLRMQTGLAPLMAFANPLPCTSDCFWVDGDLKRIEPLKV